MKAAKGKKEQKQGTDPGESIFSAWQAWQAACEKWEEAKKQGADPDASLDAAIAESISEKKIVLGTRVEVLETHNEEEWEGVIGKVCGITHMDPYDSLRLSGPNGEP